ncbi:hypothetical protein BDQ12DRAFT_636239 [Crucibulum laeve]|uniref:MINDY deubiquitinase domain-containing protein n=1 Tax=Crucibulum laeve TaxID=68775 RepID=A0A5C3LRB2_9AGAR|nr:hypothetical protein BDQ12DRAFT_636239 [Crucibulum laeve]
MSQEAPTVQSSKAEVWYLKDIRYKDKPLRIITQNFNGPCSFIAICNILILRGEIEILPKERTTVSYEFLSQLVAEYLLTSSPDVDVSAALSIMPYTQKGLDLNPLFTAATSFRPAGTGGGELKLFEQVGIPLIHGWLVDPASPEAAVMQNIEDYDTGVNLIAEADHLTNGRLVVNENAADPASPTSPTNYSDEEKEKIEDAIVVRRFIQNTWSQLTYYGLFHLASTLDPGALVALFRSSHLSVLYKGEGEDTSLYTLVTDQVFLNEPSVVWERLEDVDGGSSTFVDSDFVHSSPAGGDFAGQTAEDALRAAEMQAGQYQGIEDPNDRALAQQLQAEEERYARQEHEEYLRERQRRQDAQMAEEERQRQQQQQQQQKPPKVKRKKSDCIIM